MRPKRELWLWLWLGGLALALVPLLAAIAIAYFAKQANYGLFSNFWMPAAVFMFAAAFTCFYGAIAGWPFPPRPAAAARFPALKVDIYGAGTLQTEHEAGTGLIVPAHMRSFDVRIGNTEPDLSVTVSAQLYIRLIPGSWGRAAEAVCPTPEWPLPSSLSVGPLSLPVVLRPGSEISGLLLFEVPGYYLDKLTSPADGRLELRDHGSGKRMSIPAELGSYDRSQMTPASGMAGTLGPEFDQPAIEPGDGGQPPG